jgi:transposase
MSCLLDTIPGVGGEVAKVIVSEIGIDMSYFPSADALASWAGAAPGNNESACRRRSGKTTQGNKALSVALNQAAHGASYTREAYFSAQ